MKKKTPAKNGSSHQQTTDVQEKENQMSHRERARECSDQIVRIELEVSKCTVSKCYCCNLNEDIKLRNAKLGIPHKKMISNILHKRMCSGTHHHHINQSEHPDTEIAETSRPKFSDMSQRKKMERKKKIRRLEDAKSSTTSQKTKHLFLPERISFQIYCERRTCSHDCQNKRLMGVGGELTFLKLNKILAFCGANCLLTVNEGDGCKRETLMEYVGI
jgi:predicted DNA binding CopG/RHH family protein